MADAYKILKIIGRELTRNTDDQKEVYARVIKAARLVSDCYNVTVVKSEIVTVSRYIMAYKKTNKNRGTGLKRRGTYAS